MECAPQTRCLSNPTWIITGESIVALIYMLYSLLWLLSVTFTRYRCTPGLLLAFPFFRTFKDTLNLSLEPSDTYDDVPRRC